MIEPNKFVKSFLELIQSIRKKNWKILIDTSFISRPSTGFYCTMPKGNMILTPEGFITSCVEISKRNEPFSEVLLYGRWDNNNKRLIFDKEKLRKVHKFHFTEFESCRNCNLKLICKGGCPMRRFWIMKNGISQSQYFCSINKLLLPSILKLISNDKGYAQFLLYGFETKELDRPQN